MNSRSNRFVSAALAALLAGCGTPTPKQNQEPVAKRVPAPAAAPVATPSKTPATTPVATPAPSKAAATPSAPATASAGGAVPARAGTVPASAGAPPARAVPSSSAKIGAATPAATAAAAQPGGAAAAEPVVLAPIPERAQSQYAQALQLMKAGKALDAELEFKQLAVAYPDYSGPQLNLGLLYLHD